MGVTAFHWYHADNLSLKYQVLSVIDLTSKQKAHYQIVSWTRVSADWFGIQKKVIWSMFAHVAISYYLVKQWSLKTF